MSIAKSARNRRRRRSPRLALAIAGLALSGCTGYQFVFGPEGVNLVLSGPDDPAPAIAIAEPAGATNATIGVAGIIRWADIASTPGTSVRISAQRQSNLQEDIGDPIQLVGDGTTGSGTDALADGESDVFLWDVTGVRVGDYVITATMDVPDGTTISVVSRDNDRGTSGVITVTTALPVPTLNFTAPGAADETVTTGNTFDITWTDNGQNNADALVTLGLDTDDDHESGNEIILLRDQLLSTDGNAGMFTFAFLDENGNTVPDDGYTVFAIVDDNANDPVTREATGMLVLNP